MKTLKINVESLILPLLSLLNLYLLVFTFPDYPKVLGGGIFFLVLCPISVCFIGKLKTLFREIYFVTIICELFVLMNFFRYFESLDIFTISEILSIGICIFISIFTTFYFLTTQLIRNEWQEDLNKTILSKKLHGFFDLALLLYIVCILSASGGYWIMRNTYISLLFANKNNAEIFFTDICILPTVFFVSMLYLLIRDISEVEIASLKTTKENYAIKPLENKSKVLILFFILSFTFIEIEKFRHAWIFFFFSMFLFVFLIKINWKFLKTRFLSPSSIDIVNKASKPFSETILDVSDPIKAIAVISLFSFLIGFSLSITAALYSLMNFLHPSS